MANNPNLAVIYYHNMIIYLENSKFTHKLAI